MKKILLIALFIKSLIGYTQILDTTFNGSGVVTSSFSNAQSSESIIQSEIQSDGKIVYLGNYFKNNLIYGGLDGAYIARYNSNGSLDTTFNSTGFRIFKNHYLVTFGLTTPGNNFYNLKIQSDGKILVTVNSYIYRFNVDGSYDSTFGINGCTQVYYNNINITFNLIKIQTDNKIILGNSSSKILVRLNSDGSLDTNFNTDGIAVYNLGSPLDEYFNDITIQTDGKLLINFLTNSYTSSTSTTLNFTSTILRLNNDGSVDNLFGNNGITTPLYALNSDFVSYLSLQIDGKILVSGPFTYNLAIARYNTDGSIDSSFGVNGITHLTNLAFNGTINKIKSYTDGKIVALVTGNITNSNNNTIPVYKIYKLNSNGSTDNTFATNGEYYSNPIYSDANSITIKNDGTLTILGSFIDYTNYINDDSLLHRLVKNELSEDGILQNSTIFNIKQNFNEINGLIEQVSGKIITFINSNKLLRYNLNGSIDSTFGNNGILNLNATNSNKIVKQTDENFLLYQTNYPNIYRRNSDGILDLSFGSNGELILPNIGFINNIYPTSDNKLFILSTDYSYFIQKLNNDGTIDTSFVLDNFDSSGLFGRFNFYDDNEGETSENMIIQSDNKIVIAVSLVGTINGSIATGLIRLNPNGSIDNTFGINGKIVIQENNYIIPKKMCILENNSFVINFDIGHGLTKLYKYDSNGVLDLNFSNSAILNDRYSNNEIVIQSDFKIIKSTNINNQFTMLRYSNLTGDLDTTFGTNGVINTSIGLASNIHQLNLLQNNTLLASGTSFDGANEGVAVSRYVNLNLGNLNFINQNTQILIYPNPIQDEATFEYSLQNDEVVSIEIIDMQGKIVETVFKDNELSHGNYKQYINVSSLAASGYYILKFSSSKGSQAIKFIKK